MNPSSRQNVDLLLYSKYSGTVQRSLVIEEASIRLVRCARPGLDGHSTHAPRARAPL